jgi:hypothetical protein
MRSMPAASRLVSASLVLLAIAPAARAQEPARSIRASAARAAATVAADQTPDRPGRGVLFWSGVALGAAGVTTAVLGVTVARVERSSTGNAPAGAYQACVAQTRDPIYATNQCDELKGKNRALLWGGVAIGAAGAAILIADRGVHAEISAGAARIFHVVRF